MNLQVNVKVSSDMIESKEVVERIVNENITTKLDNYLNKFKKEDSEWIIKVNIVKDKKWLFNWSINASFDWDSYRSEREEFKNLADLVNHMFDHIKWQLSDEKK